LCKFIPTFAATAATMLLFSPIKSPRAMSPAAPPRRASTGAQRPCTLVSPGVRRCVPKAPRFPAVDFRYSGLSLGPKKSVEVWHRSGTCRRARAASEERIGDTPCAEPSMTAQHSTMVTRDIFDASPQLDSRRLAALTLSQPHQCLLACSLQRCETGPVSSAAANTLRVLATVGLPVSAALPKP